jgi:glycosyltransferase involved in cell wall biosynthesis
MRVAYLTAGAAGMYCGSCMRDNTLAAALREQGLDILLLPLYTPIRTDEADVSEPCVLYGGINVYLQQKSRLFRHLPARLSRLLDAPWLLRKVSRGADSGSPDDLGAMTVSMLKGRHGAQRQELTRLIRWLSRNRVDLVNLPNAMFLGAAGAIRQELAVPVVCTLTGEDLFLDALPEPWRSEALALIRQQAGDSDAFIAVTRYYASRAVEHLGMPKDRIEVVPLGVRADDLALPQPERANAREPFTIGYLARVCPEKGLHILCEAFRILLAQGRRCRLRVAGYVSSTNQGFLGALREQMPQEARETFEYVGEVDRAGKCAFLRSLQVLSVPTVYREAKGIYVLEALAAGVPVVQPDHGAFPEMIEATGGGVLFEANNPTALAQAVARLMDDAALREQMACRGQAAVLQSYTDRVMAERTWKVYERLVSKNQISRRDAEDAENEVGKKRT